MNVSLTPELEQFIGRKVESGMYQTASEVVREGLRLLKERDEDYQRRLEELRKEIAIGLEEAERGELSDFTEETLAEIRADGIKRLAAKKRRREEIRKEIAVGLEQAERGQVKPLNEEAAARIKARGRERLGDGS